MKASTTPNTDASVYLYNSPLGCRRTKNKTTNRGNEKYQSTTTISHQNGK